MKLLPNFDPEKKRITFNLECNLLDKYYSNFAGLIENSPNMPKGTEVDKDGSGCAVVSIPMAEFEADMVPVNEDTTRLVIDPEKIAELTRIINEFVNGALSDVLKTTEFLPLNGYSVDDLKADVRLAVRNKRTFCIIGQYSEYLEMTSNRTYKFHQVIVEPNTEEYADVAIMITNGEMDQLRNEYEPKLELIDWC